MQAQISQLEQTLQLPGVPQDERAIYTDTIRRIQAEISARQTQNEATKQNTPPPIPSPKPSPLEGGKGGEQHTANPQQITINPSENYIIQQKTDQAIQKPTRTIHAGNQTPVPSGGAITATIQAAHDSDPYNPSITITWADGYTITVDETAARSRFTSTLRDTFNLRHARDGRYHLIWRWSSPWRALGFYQALTAFRGGNPPTLRDLDITRPNNLTTDIFNTIAQKAAEMQTNH